MSEETLRMPDVSLLSFRLDNDPLKRLLEQLLESTEENKKSIASLKSTQESDVKDLYRELSRVGDMEKELKACVETCGTVGRLEASVAPLSSQLRELSSNFRFLETSEAQRRKEAMLQLKGEVSMRIHELAQTLTGEGVDPLSSLKGGNSLETESGDDLGMIRDAKQYKNLHMRVLNIERRMASIGDISPSRDKREPLFSLLSDISNPSQMDDFQHELHLKLITVLNEANTIKEMFQKIDGGKDMLEAVEIPNFSNYVSYQKRLQSLEEKSLIYARQSDIISLSHEISSIKPISHLSPPSPLLEPRYLPTTNEGFSAQISELRLAVEELRQDGKMREIGGKEERLGTEEGKKQDSIAQQRAKEMASAEVDKNIETLHQTVKSLTKSLSQCVLRSELDSFIRPYKPNFPPKADPHQPDFSEFSQRIDLVDAKLSFFWDELNKIKSSYSEQSKGIDKLESLINQTNTVVDGSVQRLRTEVKGQIATLTASIDRPAEDQSSMKSVISLKLAVTKLQRDVRELIAVVEDIPKNQAQVPIQIPEIETQSDESSNQALKAVSGVIRKHDSDLRTISQQLLSVTTDISDLRQSLRKQHDSLTVSYLKHLESVRSDMDVIVSKVAEGAKLTQRDFEKISELFELVDHKGEKSDIETKAGKDDLRKSAHLLSHRIEELRFLLRRLETEKEEVKRNEEACLTKKFEMECLSCGQSTRGSQKEGREGGFKVGPGFSKILNFLKTVANTEDSGHLRTRSDLSGSLTERVIEKKETKRWNIKLPKVRKAGQI